MTSEGLGEVFKGDSADMCTGKFPLVSMGGRANSQACADGERGPPSARSETFKQTLLFIIHYCNPIQQMTVDPWSRSHGLVWYLILVRAECVRQRNEVAIKLGIIFSSPLSRHLLNLQEKVVVGFPNFAWAPK
jgi:hypothetical protein